MGNSLSVVACLGFEAKIDGELVCGAGCMAAAAAHKGAVLLVVLAVEEVGQ